MVVVVTLSVAVTLYQSLKGTSISVEVMVAIVLLPPLLNNLFFMSMLSWLH